MWWNGMMDGAGGGWFWFGLLHMVLWWVLLALGIAVLVKWLRGDSRGGDHDRDRSLIILRERYARGEIDRDEFERLRRELAA